MLSCLCFQSNAQISYNKKDVKCRGGEDGFIELNIDNVTPPVMYAWSDGPGGRTRSNLSAGTYTCSVTDATDCGSTVSVTITEPQKVLKVTIRVEPVSGKYACGENIPVWVIAEASGGTHPYKINGAPGVSKTIKISHSQWVTFNVKDKNGCVVSKKRVVLVGSRFCPKDPNDILGPAGYGDEEWVSKNDTLNYTVRFENDATFATAPAQRVFVTHQLDNNINPYSFRLGSFGFGDHIFDVPPGMSIYQKRIDLTSEHNVFLDVVAGLDVVNNQAFWSFIAIDPLTGLQPTDPLVGFLPVNDTLTGSGEGFVSFSIRPDATSQTGDTVVARADIIFDGNEAIATNVWTNLIDALPPTTMMDTLPPQGTADTLLLSWSGSDDSGGSGIREFEIYMSRDSAPFINLITIPSDTFMYLYQGDYGADYQFYIVGIDNTGNRESKSSTEASTYILPQKDVRINSTLPDYACMGDTIMIDWSTVLVDSVNIVFSLDSGVTFQSLAIGTDTTQSPLLWVLPDTLSDQSVRIWITDSDSISIVDSTMFIQVKGFPIVNAGPDTSLCKGDLIYLIASGANDYIWSPQIGLNLETKAIQGLTGDSTTMYNLAGTDVFGCQNTDSIHITVFPLPRDTVLHEICLGDSILIDGNWIDTLGEVEVIEMSLQGCDSTIVHIISEKDTCWYGGAVAYVDSAATGANDGTTWVDAFDDLQDALTYARIFSEIEEIWVADGTYTPDTASNRSLSFTLQDSMTVYGGFAGGEANIGERDPLVNIVQLNGDLGVQGDSTDNAFHVVNVLSTCSDCVLDGVVITMGYANGSAGVDDRGAGILVEGKATLRNVIIEHNSTTGSGAAVFNTGNQAVLVVDDCILRLNTSLIGQNVINVNGAVLKVRNSTRVEDDDD
ncbi:MAG: hypothetical protein DRI69_01410 [Bacteroidetes bacterium]|nr:MAG: hypothetical protein DRI69_01410 [Bacteroidota bacterium]